MVELCQFIAQQLPLFIVLVLSNIVGNLTILHGKRRLYRFSRRERERERESKKGHKEYSFINLVLVNR